MAEAVWTALSSTGATLTFGAYTFTDGGPRFQGHVLVVGGAPVDASNPLPIKPGSSGPLTDRSATLNGVNWAAIDAEDEGRSTFIVQNVNNSEAVEVVFGTLPVTGPSPTAGAILLQPGAMLSPQTFGNYCPTSPIYARCLSADAAGVLFTAKVG